MTIYQWLCLLGVPALIAGMFGTFWRQIKGVQMGVKALLRAQMISENNAWSERGYATIEVKQNFDNLWVQYHNIKGPNGVVDGIHDSFMALPTKKPQKREENDQ